RDVRGRGLAPAAAGSEAAKLFRARSRSYPRPLVLFLNRRLADLLNRLHKVSRVLSAHCVFPCARGGRHQVAAGVVARRRRSYGDAADRQRDRANGGLARWVCLLWNFGGYWPLAS